MLFYAKRNIQPGDTLFMDYNAGGFEEYPTDNFSWCFVKLHLAGNSNLPDQISSEIEETSY